MADNVELRISVDYDYRSANENLKQLLKRLETENQLTLNIDKDLLKNVEIELNKLKKQFENSNININTNTSEADKKIKELYKSIEEVEKKYKQFGKVTFPQIIKDEETENIKEFILQLEKADGIIQKLKFDSINVESGNEIISMFQSTGIIKEIDKTNDIIEKNLRETQKINNQINNERIESQQEASALAIRLTNEENQERLKITTETQKNIEKFILQSNETIGNQQDRITKRNANNYEELWKKLLHQEDKEKSVIFGNFPELQKSNLEMIDVAKVLSREYGNLEIRGMSLNKITGEYSVELRKSAKENLNLKGTVNQLNGELRIQNEIVRQARNVQLGFWEQLKIALERVKFSPLY